jgi:hypothetical protein
MTRSSGEGSACPLLLEVLSELHKSLPFFVDARCRCRGVVVSWHAEVVVSVMLLLIDVEALASWVVTLVVKVVAIIRVAGEVVVTCGP